MSLIVVKCGGTAAVDAERVCADIARLVGDGRRVVLAHGGSADIERLARRMAVPQRRLAAPDGVTSRYTDEATMEIVTLALAGAVKPRLLAELAGRGVPAIGLTGIDGALLSARRKRAQRAIVDGRRVLVRDNQAGVVTDVNAHLLRTLLDAGLVPVVSPPALAEDGRPVNVDADRAAAKVATALMADEIVFLTGAPGVLRDPDDPASVLETCAVPLEGGPGEWARGGMALKLIAAREALTGGVPSVVIADGGADRPIHRAAAGAGSRIVLEHQEKAMAR